MIKLTAKSHNAGFTLLELVITFTLAILALGMFAPVLSAGFNAFGTNAAIRETVNRARPAMQRIRMELLNAVSTPTIGTGGSSLTFTFKESPSNLTVTYDLAGGYLRRNGVNMAEGVTFLNFDMTSVGTPPLYTVRTQLTVAWMGVSLPLDSSVLLRGLLPCI